MTKELEPDAGVRVRGFTVGGFKSYGTAQQMPLAPLTVLIGANASGKSNVIEAMQLLGWLSRGHRLGDLSHALREGELAVRGRPTDLPSGGTDVALGCTLAVEPGAELTLALTLRIDSRGPRIVAEDLKDSRTPVALYHVEQAASEHGSELTVAYNNFRSGQNKPRIACVDQQAVFTQLMTPARFDAKHKDSQTRIPTSAGMVAHALAHALFLDPQPRAMRGYSYKDEGELLANGSNVSAVLNRLCSSEEGQRRVLEFVRALPEQDIQRIGFLEGPRNDVMVQLVETFGATARPVDAAVLSDGTLRVLAVAAAVLSAQAGSLVVIEEIDNGVHPSRAASLMEALHRTAKERGIQLLLTTHNPALLDAVPKQALGDTVACYRDSATGQSRLQRLSDLEDFVALTAQGPLGWLATSGTLDRFLKQRRSQLERKEQGQQVLKLLRGV